MLKLTLLCSSKQHPMYARLDEWRRRQTCAAVDLLTSCAEIDAGGDILIMVSCTEIVPASICQRFSHALVLHASDLPSGRGWSPHVWDILNGSHLLTLSLLEAAEPVDSGAIWKKTQISLNGTELYDEINAKLFTAELELIEWSCRNYDQVKPQPQIGAASFHRRRTPTDSQLDANKTIAEQFELLRVCDPVRFPAFFEYRGQRYLLRIEKDE